MGFGPTGFKRNRPYFWPSARRSPFGLKTFTIRVVRQKIRSRIDRISRGLMSKCRRICRLRRCSSIEGGAGSEQDRARGHAQVVGRRPSLSRSCAGAVCPNTIKLCAPVLTKSTCPPDYGSVRKLPCHGEPSQDVAGGGQGHTMPF